MSERNIAKTQDIADHSDCEPTLGYVQKQK